MLCAERVAPGTIAGRRHLGCLPDAADAFPDLTVAELVSLTLALKRVAVEPAVVARWRQRPGLDASFAQRLRALLFGQRKRAFLPSALLGDPWLLILDEPSSGHDPAGSALVCEMIHERRAARLGCLVASNDAAFVRAVGGSAYHLVGGRLASSQ